MAKDHDKLTLGNQGISGGPRRLAVLTLASRGKTVVDGFHCVDAISRVGFSNGIGESRVGTMLVNLPGKNGEPLNIDWVTYLRFERPLHEGVRAAVASINSNQGIPDPDLNNLSLIVGSDVVNKTALGIETVTGESFNLASGRTQVLKTHRAHFPKGYSQGVTGYEASLSLTEQKAVIAEILHLASDAGKVIPEDSQNIKARAKHLIDSAVQVCSESTLTTETGMAYIQADQVATEVFLRLSEALGYDIRELVEHQTTGDIFTLTNSSSSEVPGAHQLLDLWLTNPDLLRNAYNEVAKTYNERAYGHEKGLEKHAMPFYAIIDGHRCFLYYDESQRSIAIQVPDAIKGYFGNNQENLIVIPNIHNYSDLAHAIQGIVEKSSAPDKTVRVLPTKLGVPVALRAAGINFSDAGPGVSYMQQIDYLVETLKSYSAEMAMPPYFDNMMALQITKDVHHIDFKTLDAIENVDPPKAIKLPNFMRLFFDGEEISSRYLKATLQERKQFFESIGINTSGQSPNFDNIEELTHFLTAISASLDQSQFSEFHALADSVRSIMQTHSEIALKKTNGVLSEIGQKFSLLDVPEIEQDQLTRLNTIMALINSFYNATLDNPKNKPDAVFLQWVYTPLARACEFINLARRFQNDPNSRQMIMERLLIAFNERSVPDMPQGVFGLESLSQTDSLGQGRKELQLISDIFSKLEQFSTTYPHIIDKLMNLAEGDTQAFAEFSLDIMAMNPNDLSAFIDLTMAQSRLNRVWKPSEEVAAHVESNNPIKGSKAVQDQLNQIRSNYQLMYDEFVQRVLLTYGPENLTQKRNGEKPEKFDKRREDVTTIYNTLQKNKLENALRYVAENLWVGIKGTDNTFSQAESFTHALNLYLLFGDDLIKGIVNNAEVRTAPHVYSRENITLYVKDRMPHVDVLPAASEVEVSPEVLGRLQAIGPLTLGDGVKTSVFTAVKELASSDGYVRELLTSSSTGIGKAIDEEVLANPHDPFFNTINIYRPDMIVSPNGDVFANELEIVVGGTGAMFALVEKHLYGTPYITDHLVSAMETTRDELGLDGVMAVVADSYGVSQPKSWGWLEKEYKGRFMSGHTHELQITHEGVFLRGQKLACVYPFIKAHKLDEGKAIENDFLLLEAWLNRKVAMVAPLTLVMDNKAIHYLLQKPEYDTFFAEFIGRGRLEDLRRFLPETFVLTSYELAHNEKLQQIISNPIPHGRFIVKPQKLWDSQGIFMSPIESTGLEQWHASLKHLMANPEKFGNIIIQEFKEQVVLPSGPNGDQLANSKFLPYFIATEGKRPIYINTGVVTTQGRPWVNDDDSRFTTEYSIVK